MSSPVPNQWKTIAILGTGTMGRGIAQVAATAGLNVFLYDASHEVLREAMTAVVAGLAKLEAKGTITREQAENARERIRAAQQRAEALERCDLAIEVIPEQLELKKALFRDVEPLMPPGAVLATNTSSISIRDLASGLQRPERFLGLHFFNPVPVMKLLEIVPGEKTDPALVEKARAFARALGKEPILVKDTPGFASSRLGVALGLEAMRMLEEGVASAEDIDRAMELGYAHPIGPLKLSDIVGLDVRLAIAEELEKRLGPRFSPPEILRRKVAEGRLGRKSKHGFYDYDKG